MSNRYYWPHCNGEPSALGLRTYTDSESGVNVTIKEAHLGCQTFSTGNSGLYIGVITKELFSGKGQIQMGIRSTASDYSSGNVFGWQSSTGKGFTISSPAKKQLVLSTDPDYSPAKYQSGSWTLKSSGGGYLSETTNLSIFGRKWTKRVGGC